MIDNTANKRHFYDIEQVKEAADGQWIEILAAAGIPAEILDGKGHPCPKCGGVDRFAAFPDCDERGAVICRNCFSTGNGDGLATLCWFTGKSFPEALQFVGDCLDLPASELSEPRKSEENSSMSTSTHRSQGKQSGTLYSSASFAAKKLDEFMAEKEQGRRVAYWTYVDAQLQPVAVIVRYDLPTPAGEKQKKTFRPVSKHGNGWRWGGPPGQWPMYMLPHSYFSETVFVCEGEKAASVLFGIELTATTSPHGAKGVDLVDWSPLNGKRVIIVPDNDLPGREYAYHVATKLSGLNVPPEMRLLELPDLPDHGDAYDFVEARRGSGMTDEQIAAELLTLADSAMVIDSQNIQDILEWDEIEPLDVIEVPEFPIDALPEPLHSWVAAEATATQTPPDLAGLLALTVVSATIARRFEVRPRQDWKEPVNLFTAVMLEPGNRKSAVFSDATQPLQELERELIGAQKPEIAKEEERRRQRQEKLKELQKAAKDKPEAAQEAEELAAELAAEPKLKLPRKIVDDATSEKLGIMLQEQGGRIASMSPEGGVFDLMAGQYSKSGTPVFGVYLMGHSGDDLRVDRVTRSDIFVKRPALTMGLAIQPEVIRGLGDKTAFRGRGLLGRFLYAIPKSRIGERDSDPPAVPSEVKSEYRELIRRLDALQIRGDGKDSIYLELTPEAQDDLVAWMDEIEAMLDDGGEMEKTRDWGSKLAGHTLRIAAVIHCIKHDRPWDQAVDSESLHAASQIARYLIPHAEVVLEMIEADEEGELADALYVLKWIKRHQKKTFTKSEAQQHGRRRFPQATDINKPLKTLEDRNYIRKRPDKGRNGPGRPPSPVYDVNPALFEAPQPRSRTKYSEQPADDQAEGNSQNIQDTFDQDVEPNRLDAA